MLKKQQRIAAASPKTVLGSPMANADLVADSIKRASGLDVDFIVFPELALAGASLGSLLSHPHMLDLSGRALESICRATENLSITAAVGYPCEINGSVRSAVALINRGSVLATSFSDCAEAPFGFIPSVEYHLSKPRSIFPRNINVVFGNELLSSKLSVPDGNVTLIPSFLNATAHSDRLISEALRRYTAISGFAAAYAAPNSGESSSFFLYDGLCAISAGGEIIAMTEPFSDDPFVYADVNAAWLASAKAVPVMQQPTYYLSQKPERAAHECRRILRLQAEALRRRLEHTGGRGFIIGVSGGLDSALAAIAAVKAADMMGLPRSGVLGVSMPGFGTSIRTRENSRKLCETLGCSFREISIVDACAAHLEAIGHGTDKRDVVYENAQARERTQILLDLANMENLLDVGTGDLSEAALGWTTFGGDHLAQYGVNASLPKTVIRRVVAEAKAEFREAADTLQDILDTPVSPELLPSQAGEIAQKTEELLGSYEMHDFFIYQFVINKEKPSAIVEKAIRELPFDPGEIRRTFDVFIRRFFTQQYKRNCAPESPHILASISPALWRMGSDVLPDGSFREGNAGGTENA